MVTYVNTSFLQIFLYERFSGIAPRLTEFDEVTIVEVVVRGERKRKKSHPYMPRAWRWDGVKQTGTNPWSI